MSKDRTVGCYNCGDIVDERDCMPNTSEYGGNDDGGSLCPQCYCQPPMFRKVTAGFVIQTFNKNGECTGQEFIADGECNFEIETPYNGCERICQSKLPFPSDTYFPFHMVQPNITKE